MRRLYIYLRKKRAGGLILNPGVSLFIMVIIIICAIFASQIAPHDPNLGNLKKQFIPPVWMEEGSSEHLLGTDYYGRDILSRLIFGARISLLVAFVSIVVATIVGTLVGLFSGYIGGLFDSIMMRTVDGIMSIPYIMIAILLAAIFGPSFLNLIFVIALFCWPIYARQVRAEALSIKEQDYVALAKIAGVSHFKIVYKHFFFNVAPTLLVLSTFQIAEVIMWEAILSFLGIGVPPPTASWGSMSADGQDYITTIWWLSAMPGVAILITVLCANILGDWIRDHLDPRLRQL